MPKYKVKLVETVVYTLEVEAENPEAAEAVAIRNWTQSENPGAEFESYGEGVELETVSAA